MLLLNLNSIKTTQEVVFIYHFTDYFTKIITFKPIQSKL
ncbi:hypothetical protein GGR22_000574 [Flavobacterium gossypii]|uniref:Uncharacterized protein n=1 Tax=Flavobacterium gossypii TaxID=1646119 RepID=A0ABR6DLA0_9FLAO|nr:hypothetical protein [Flavobacterium gossypii]